MNESERVYAHWLHAISGIGSRSAQALLTLGTPKELYQKVPEKDINRVLNKRQQACFYEARKEERFFRDYEAFCKEGIHFTARPFAEYPSRLKEIPDAPFGLYYKGSLPDEATPTAAIIGARICSEYGRYMARQFGTELAAAGVQVVSGMALGVDGIAQKGAVAAGGKSFAVLGSGVDVCYPEENRDLYASLCENGGILSEYVPQTKPEARLFPPRNRIISGLSDLLLVVEARQKSGTLITVDMALEQGKDVYAVPGRVTDRLSDGCNHLIKQGAGIAFSAGEILDALFGARDMIKKEDKKEERRSLQFSSLEQALLELIDIQPVSVNTVSEKLSETGLRSTVPVLMNTMMGLCFKGLLQQEGGYFMRRLG